MFNIPFFRNLLIFSFLVGATTYGQVKIPSPNAASLGIFGEVPVSYYTGIPNISVPILDIKGKNLNLPISLDYHAAGMRPEQHTGWVGLGWNLSVGGAITRIVKGLADEAKNGAAELLGITRGEFGYYYISKYNVFSDPNWASLALTSSQPIFDTEPDEFMFNFLGHSGKFFLDEQGQWRVQSDEPLKVIFDNQWVYPFIFTSSPRSNYLNSSGGNYITQTFKHFTIIDGLGNQYIFGSDTENNDNAIEYTNPMISPDANVAGASFTANTWHLTKIIAANKTEVIDYTYERGPFISNLSYYYANSGSSASGLPGLLGGTISCYNLSGGGVYMAGSFTSPVYLKQIDYPQRNLKISFNTSKSDDLKYNNIYYSWLEQLSGYASNGLDGALISEASANIPYFRDPSDSHPITPYQSGQPFSYPNLIWLKLDGITLTNGDESLLIKKINFQYSENPNYRLELNSVQIAGSDNVAVQNYSFHYYGEQNSQPPYLAGINDHWGFHNGVYSYPLNTFGGINSQQTYYLNNVSSILDESLSGGAHVPNLEKTKCRILDKITYPTGGSTAFEYQLNDFSAYVDKDNRAQLYNMVGSAGGLRIYKITNDDGLGNLTSKTLYYKKAFNLQTNIDDLPSSGILNVKPAYTHAFHSSDGIQTFGSYSISTTPVVPLTLNSSGIHVAYSEVTEMRSDGSYSTYKFTNHDVPACTDQNPLKYINIGFQNVKAFGSYNFSRGKLISTEVFDNTGKLITKKKTTYKDVGFNIIKALYKQVIGICNGGGIMSTAAYITPCYVRLPDTEHTYSYNQTGNTYLEDIKTYTYDQNYKLVKTVVTQTSDKKSKSLSYDYPFDINMQPYVEMTSKNIVGTPVERRELLASSIVRSVKTNYFKWSNDVFAPVTIEEKKGNHGFVTKARFYNYDINGSLLSFSKESDIVHTYLWGYNSLFPVAEIVSANGNFNTNYLNNAIINNLTSSDQDKRNELNKIRTNLATSSALVNTYTYNPYFGMTSQTDPAGRTTYYEYDNFGRLMHIRDEDNNILKKYCYNYAGQPIDCKPTNRPNIYLRISYENTYSNWGSIYGNAVVRFYSDEACTQPLSVTNLALQYNFYFPCYEGMNYSLSPISVVANGTSITLATNELLQYWDSREINGESVPVLCNNTYAILNADNYNIVR